MIADNIELKPEFYSQKTVILSKSGYGKSYTSRVIIEDGQKNGNTFTIIDPQDAYLNLKGFEYVKISDVKDPKAYGILLAQSRKNTVIRTKHESEEDQNKFLHTFLTSYKKNIQKGIQTLVIDEVHKFAPEGANTLSKNVVRGLSQENRSDGLGIITVTQRVSRLDKTILSQADNLFIGRVTSFRDKEAVKNYIDNPEDLEKIAVLEKGQFYLYGLTDEPSIVQIRKAETTHSGEAPKNLLSEKNEYYLKYAPRILKKGSVKNMAETEIIKDIVPSTETFKDYALMGAKMALGMGVAGMVGNVTGNLIKSPIPVISTRTLGSAVTVVALYAVHKNVPMAKDITKYAVAGACAYTAGSLIFDVLDFTNINVPILNSAISMTTLVPVTQKASASSEADTNTLFA